MRCAHTAVPPNSFKHHDKLFFETSRKTSRNSAQRRRSPPSNRPASLLPLHRRRTSAGHLNPSGDLSMSKRIALLSAAAFSALALTATLVAPVSAQEKTVMVGGAAMFPSKNIIQNAVHSKDHTTLVAAVKAAGLVETLEGKGPFTVFAPTNTAFGKLPAGTVDTLVKPENKATLTKILTYHVVPGRYGFSALSSAIKKGGGKAELATASGGKLTFRQNGMHNIAVTDDGGNTANISTYDVNQ